MSGMIPAQQPPPIDMRAGIRYDLSPGTTTRSFLLMNGPIVRALRKSDFNRVMKNALILAGEHWRTQFMPLRFTPESPVVVTSGNRWNSTKMRVARRWLPQFVGLTPKGGGREDGPWWQRNKAKMIITVFKTARTAFKSKGPNAGSAIVSMSYGHGIREEKAKGFKTIAPMEWQAMQLLMVGYLAEQFAGAQSYTKRKTGSMKAAEKAMKYANVPAATRRAVLRPGIGLRLGKQSRSITENYRARAIGGPRG